MTSTTAQVRRWWKPTSLDRADAGRDVFAPDGLDAYSSRLQAGLVLLTFLAVSFWINIYLDGDTGWHLGAGQWIVANRTIPTVDPFSHTFAGAPWTAHEWLAEILMVAASLVAGWAGLALLFAAAASITVWLLARESFRYLPARWAIGMVVIALGTLVPFSLARPHMLAWPLVAIWTLVLLRAREHRSAPPVAAALLMIIWANLHGSYIVALGLAGLFGLESLIEHPRDRRLLGRWLMFGMAAVAAALVTPFGPAHFLYPFEVSGMDALGIIGEWRRSTFLTDSLFFVSLAGLGMVVWMRRANLPLLRILMLAGLAAMAILHARHQMLFAIIGVLVVLPILNPDGSPEERAVIAPARWLFPALVAAALIRLAMPYQLPESSTYPMTLLERVPAEMRAQPVYNEYSQGGPLVMLGIRPYIDGRADMYGDAHTFRARAITRGDIVKFREDARRFGIGWVLLERENGLVKRLDREPGWRRFAADRHAVIFVRS